MTSLARVQRDAYCDALLDAGPTARTLCEGWDAHELAVHSVLRESGDPRAIGYYVPALAAWTDSAAEGLRKRWTFEALVELLRSGPPPLSPMALPGADEAANAVEFFVHTEDVRRAQPGVEPRPTDAALEAHCARRLAQLAKLLLRRAPCGMTFERSDTGETLMVKRGTHRVVVIGTPTELLLFAFGRRAQARVRLLGRDGDILALGAGTGPADQRGGSRQEK